MDLAFLVPTNTEHRLSTKAIRSCGRCGWSAWVYPWFLVLGILKINLLFIPCNYTKEERLPFVTSEQIVTYVLRFSTFLSFNSCGIHPKVFWIFSISRNQAFRSNRYDSATVFFKWKQEIDAVRECSLFDANFDILSTTTQYYAHIFPIYYPCASDTRLMTQQNFAKSNLYSTNCSGAPSIVWSPHFILVHLVEFIVFGD